MGTCCGKPKGKKRKDDRPIQEDKTQFDDVKGENGDSKSLEDNKKSEEDKPKQHQASGEEVAGKDQISASDDKKKRIPSGSKESRDGEKASSNEIVPSDEKKGGIRRRLTKRKKMKSKGPKPVVREEKEKKKEKKKHNSDSEIDYWLTEEERLASKEVIQGGSKEVVKGGGSKELPVEKPVEAALPVDPLPSVNIGTCRELQRSTRTGIPIPPTMGSMEKQKADQPAKREKQQSWERLFGAQVATWVFDLTYK
ncbi:hypothetical protein Q1695_009737 [Nippostrongylus brasiliensis]|nr:hypothetical protein Q1695_009737 [Nippostrongylus brasiliensis]